MHFGAVDNTGANQSGSPISLIVANGAEVTELFDVGQQAGVRAVHNSADATNVDVLVDNSVAFTNLAFPDVVPGASLDAYAEVPAGIRNVKVTPGTYNLVVTYSSGNTASGPAKVDLGAGSVYIVIARDTQALDSADLILLDDFVPVSQSN